MEAEGWMRLPKGDMRLCGEGARLFEKRRWMHAAQADRGLHRGVVTVV
jgi:hypothetical protein